MGTLCGALLPFDQIEGMAAGVGVPCSGCVLEPADMPPPAVAIGYQERGWPVAVCADRVLLVLGDSTTALALPVWLVDAITPALIARDHAAPVLAPPGVPEHRILLVGEPFGAGLPWPAGVHTIGGVCRCRPPSRPSGRCAGCSLRSIRIWPRAVRSISSARCAPRCGRRRRHPAGCHEPGDRGLQAQGRGVGLSRCRYTVRWRPGDPVAHVLYGQQMDNHGTAGVVDTIPVAPSGWTDLAEVRQLGQRWWSRQRAQRAHGRDAC